MNELRIGYFGSSTAADGGSELCLLRMARHFREKGEVTLFLPDAGPLFEKARAANLDAVNLDFIRLKKHRGRDWLKWGWSVRKTRRRLLDEIRTRNLNLLHFNDLIDAPYYSVPCRAGVPAVSHLRFILSSSFSRKIYQSLARKSGLTVLPVSEAIDDAMLGADSGISSQVLYDPCPDPSCFHPDREGEEADRERIRKKFGWGDETFVLVMVSKLLETKGHLHFIRTAMELERISHGECAYLMIAGASPGREGYENQVRSSWESLPTEQKHWIPSVSHEELGRCLRTSDVLLHLPDIHDSFPGVVLEAMACGLPVVAHRLGGIPEQLDRGKAGILVEKGDLSGVVGAVRSLKKNPSERKKMADAAFERVRGVFSADEHFTRLSEIYAEKIGRGAGESF